MAVLAKYKAPGFSRFGNGEPITPDNLHLLHPDPYLAIPQMVVPFEWMGACDPCSNEFKVLKEDIKKNGGSAVGLVFEIAVIPPFSKLTSIWYRNIVSVPGLKIKLSLVDISGNQFVALPKNEIDMSVSPIGSSSITETNCGGCANSPETFRAYEFDSSGDKLTTSNCNTAILQLEILEEPKEGLLGGDCKKQLPPFLEGGLGYRSFCNIRDRVYHDTLGDLSCLDRCREDIKFDESKRGKLIG